MRPTFQHLDGHLADPVGLLLVQAHGLAHHHLAEAAFAQRLPQNQPAGAKTAEPSQAGLRSPALLGGTSLPVPRKLPARVLGQLVLRHPRKHGRAAGGQAGRAHQHGSRVDGRARVHGHLRSETRTLLFSKWDAHPQNLHWDGSSFSSGWRNVRGHTQPGGRTAALTFTLT